MENIVCCERRKTLMNSIFSSIKKHVVSFNFLCRNKISEETKLKLFGSCSVERGLNISAVCMLSHNYGSMITAYGSMIIKKLNFVVDWSLPIEKYDQLRKVSVRVSLRELRSGSIFFPQMDKVPFSQSTADL